MKRARIEYPVDKVREPLLYPVSRAHGVSINVRRASINDRGGYLDVELTGDPEAVLTVLAKLRETGCGVIEQDDDDQNLESS